MIPRVRRRDKAGSLRPISVLLSLDRPGENTTFVVFMLESAPPSVEMLTFSWRRAIFGRYDVFHIHWPEHLLRGRNRWLSGWSALRTTLLLLRLRVTRTAIVRTIHNLEPHDGASRLKRPLLRLIDRHTLVTIRLTDATPAAAAGKTITIPHGHYVDRFAATPKAGIVPGRVLFFGIIKPYKGVPALVRAFANTETDGASLRIVGHPADASLRDQVRALAMLDRRVSTRFAFVDDRDLVREVSEATLVVLPYSEMHNSGAILVALSLARPVLAPNTDVNRLLREEVGSDWLDLYDGPISGVLLDDALRRADGLDRSTSPRLDDRGWAEFGLRHEAAYKLARSLAIRRFDARS